MKKNKKIKIKNRDVYFVSERIDNIDYENMLKDKYAKRSKDKANNK